jgi:hypothetical protein
MLGGMTDKEIICHLLSENIRLNIENTALKAILSSMKYQDGSRVAWRSMLKQDITALQSIPAFSKRLELLQTILDMPDERIFPLRNLPQDTSLIFLPQKTKSQKRKK